MFACLIISVGLIIVSSFIGYVTYPTEDFQRERRERALRGWEVIFHRLAHENNSIMAIDHVTHASYKRMFGIVQRYTPHVGLVSPASKQALMDGSGSVPERQSSTM